jgi:uncharacterized membrane protein
MLYRWLFFRSSTFSKPHKEAQHGRRRLATFLQIILQTTVMNVKRMFGVLLTVLGIAGLIYAAILFMNKAGGSQMRSLIVYAILGAVFFFTGIGLVKTTKDDAAPPTR